VILLGDSSIDSDSRWKSGKQSKPEVFEDYIQDEEIEQLLDPEEDYRDTTAQGLSVIDPDGDSLLDEDESTSNMTHVKLLTIYPVVSHQISINLRHQ
jgi:hypothetical protein